MDFEKPMMWTAGKHQITGSPLPALQELPRLHLGTRGCGVEMDFEKPMMWTAGKHQITIQKYRSTGMRSRLSNTAEAAFLQWN